jgi:hypothetical protein
LSYLTIEGITNYAIIYVYLSYNILPNPATI